MSHGLYQLQAHNLKREGAVADLEVFPDALYQTCLHQKPKERRPLYVLAANGIKVMKKGRTFIFPHIWCSSLQDAILRVSKHNAPTLMREQERIGNVEVVGNIVCNPKRRANGQWEVLFEVCHNRSGSEYTSEPSCGRRRKCDEPRSSPTSFIDIGEYHTHPPTEHGRLCRPPSHFDIYQLLIAAHLGHHNFVITVCTEGIYSTVATRRAVQTNIGNVWAYYHREDIHGVPFVKESSAGAINTCRMPLVDLLETLPLDRVADIGYLHRLLVRLPKVYDHLLDNHKKAPSRTAFIQHYLNALSHLGIHASFHATRSHPIHGERKASRDLWDAV